MDLLLKDDPLAIFEFIEEIAVGSFGSVYRAKHLPTGDVVAVKACVYEEDEALKDLIAEIQFLHSFSHPNVVKYYGSYKKNEEVFIAMELCEAGGSNLLFEVLEKPLTERQTAVIMRETLKGLIYLHDNNIIHRDIKAANILLNAKGEVKLADFGVSVRLRSRDDKRNTFTGTPYWMAPELVNAKDFHTFYDAKIDVWALGITCIEYAEMEPPMNNIAPMKVLLEIPKREPPRLKEPQKWSKEFIQFLQSCLVKDPERRLTAKQLSELPFVVNCTDGPEILVELIDEALAKAEEYRQQSEFNEQEQDLEGVDEEMKQKGGQLVANNRTYRPRTEQEEKRFAQERLREKMMAKQIRLVRKEQKRQQLEIDLLNDKNKAELEKLDIKQQGLKQKLQQQRQQLEKQFMKRTEESGALPVSSKKPTTKLDELPSAQLYDKIMKNMDTKKLGADVRWTQEISYYQLKKDSVDQILKYDLELLQERQAMELRHHQDLQKLKRAQLQQLKKVDIDSQIRQLHISQKLQARQFKKEQKIAFDKKKGELKQQHGSNKKSLKDALHKLKCTQQLGELQFNLEQTKARLTLEGQLQQESLEVLQRFELSLVSANHRFERLQLQQRMQRSQKHLQEQRRYFDSKHENLMKIAESTWFIKENILKETEKDLLDRIKKKQITHVTEDEVKANFKKFHSSWQLDHEDIQNQLANEFRERDFFFKNERVELMKSHHTQKEDQLEAQQKDQLAVLKDLQRDLAALYDKNAQALTKFHEDSMLNQQKLLAVLVKECPSMEDVQKQVNHEIKKSKVLLEKEQKKERAEFEEALENQRSELVTQHDGEWEQLASENPVNAEIFEVLEQERKTKGGLKRSFSMKSKKGSKIGGSKIIVPPGGEATGEHGVSPRKSTSEASVSSSSSTPSVGTTSLAKGFKLVPKKEKSEGEISSTSTAPSTSNSTSGDEVIPTPAEGQDDDEVITTPRGGEKKRPEDQPPTDLGVPITPPRSSPLEPGQSLDHSESGGLIQTPPPSSPAVSPRKPATSPAGDDGKEAITTPEPAKNVFDKTKRLSKPIVFSQHSSDYIHTPPPNRLSMKALQVSLSVDTEGGEGITTPPRGGKRTSGGGVSPRDIEELSRSKSSENVSSPAAASAKRSTSGKFESAAARLSGKIENGELTNPNRRSLKFEESSRLTEASTKSQGQNRGRAVTASGFPLSVSPRKTTDPPPPLNLSGSPSSTPEGHSPRSGKFILFKSRGSNDNVEKEKRPRRNTTSHSRSHSTSSPSSSVPFPGIRHHNSESEETSPFAHLKEEPLPSSGSVSHRGQLETPKSPSPAAAAAASSGPAPISSGSKSSSGPTGLYIPEDNPPRPASPSPPGSPALVASASSPMSTSSIRLFGLFGKKKEKESKDKDKP